MKKLVLIFALSLSFFSHSYSQLIEENFDYPAGDSLGAHGWTSFSGGATNRILVTSPGLTFPDYAGSNIGNATTILNTGQDVYKSFTSNQTSGSIYTSMIVSVDTARSSGDYFASYLPSTSTTSFTGRLYVRQASNGSISFGISKTTAASGGIFYSDSVYSMHVSYLLVLKYTMAAGATNDTVSLFIFSASAPMSEPVPTVGPVTGTAGDPADLGRFVLRQGTSSSSPNLIVDGILSANTWDNTLLPVELISFTALAKNRDVVLHWATASEINNFGFEIQRADVNNEWNIAGLVEGNGTTTSPKEYSFSDIGLNTGYYKYRLKQIDYNGNYEYFYLSNDVRIGSPASFRIFQNYPNPFNPETRIDFELPFESDVNISVFDLTGRNLGELFNGRKEAGYHTIKFNASELSSGTYFYKILAQSGELVFTETRMMVVLK